MPDPAGQPLARNLGQQAAVSNLGPTQASWHEGTDAQRVLAEHLDAVVAACTDATVFCTSVWLLPAAHLLCDRRALMVLCIRGDNRVLALLPLTWGIELIAGMPVRTLRHLGYPWSDRICLLLADDSPAVSAALIQGLTHCPQPWDLVALDELRENDVRTIVGHVTLKHALIRTRIRHCARSPILPVGGASFTELAQRYPRSLRTRINRARKKQAAAGRIEVRRVAPTPDSCAAIISALAAVEDASWKGDQGLGIFSVGQRRDFFAAVSHGLSAVDGLDVWEMRLDGQLIAYRWQPRFRGAILDYNFAHLPQYDGLSPGRVLLDDTIQAAATRGLDRVDASRGSLQRPHLLADWTTEYLDHYTLWLTNGTVRGVLLYLLATHVNPWWQRLRTCIAQIKFRVPDRGSANPSPLGDG